MSNKIEHKIEQALNRIQSIAVELGPTTSCQLGTVTRQTGLDLRFGPGVYVKQGGRTIAHNDAWRVPKWWREVMSRWQVQEKQKRID